MSNKRLRDRMIEMGKTTTDMATLVEVDPKTVARWIETGRLPHRRHRFRVSQVLELDEAELWPQLLETGGRLRRSDAELVGFYPQRGAVPGDVWRHLINSAQQRIEVLVYAGLFLVDSFPEFPDKLRGAAKAGLKVRLLFGDPSSETVAWRGKEEGIGDHLAARVRLSLTYMQPLLGVAGIEVRQHASVLYNSIYRFDDEMLVNTHVVGSPAPQNPVLHLRRTPDGPLFGHYLQSFDRVWDTSSPFETRESA
jgi:hypothetical protein